MKLFGSAIILSGGKSSRMGCNKALIKLKTKSMIEVIIDRLNVIFDDIIIVTNEPEQYAGLNIRIVTDRIKGIGPLGGIHSGLIASQSKYAFITACDMPFISLEYIGYMREQIGQYLPDAVVACKHGFIEPFHAFYSKNILEDIESNIEKGCYTTFHVLNMREIITVNEKILAQFSPDFRIFTNVNSKDDLVDIQKLF